MLNPNALTTWANVQARLGLGPEQQASAEHYINVASERANLYTGRLLAARNSTHFLSAPPGRDLLVPQWPINSIASVHHDASRRFEPGHEITDYVIDVENSALWRRGGWPQGEKAIRVVGNFGYALVPADLEESIVQLVAYWLDSPRVAYLNPQEPAAGGGYHANYVGALDLPYQVRAIWDCYRVVRF